MSPRTWQERVQDILDAIAEGGKGVRNEWHFLKPETTALYGVARRRRTFGAEDRRFECRAIWRALKYKPCQDRVRDVTQDTVLQYVRTSGSAIRVKNLFDSLNG